MPRKAVNREASKAVGDSSWFVDAPSPTFSLSNSDARVYVGDCRAVLAAVPECVAGEVDLIFADPPFNWNRAYDEWDDQMPDKDYCDVADASRPLGESKSFTGQWLDLCIRALKPTGSLWVNIPDDWAAEIVVHLKSRGLWMANWCIWHYRFGQNTSSGFINSKVHVLYFCKGAERTWKPEEVLEPSDRATTYFDPRTMNKKDGMPAGMRVPMDVWYGQYWSRIQGNNFERRVNHDNQLPELYLERVIKCASNEGDLVLDPFLGSGTTGVVAHFLKRRFIGIEYSAANAKSAFERMQSGPVRVGKVKPTGSAIFAPRNATEASKARTAPGGGESPTDGEVVIRRQRRRKADAS